MKIKIEWCIQFVKWYVIRVLHVITGKYFVQNNLYRGKKLLTAEAGNQYIYEGIMTGKPFASCRFGFVEMGILVMAFKDSIWGTNDLSKNIIFKEVFELHEHDFGKGIKRFANLMIDSGERADVICLWENMALGDFCVNHFKCNSIQKISQAGASEPYIFAKPWSRALKGKKVLVINPFSETIKKQYKLNREKLFLNAEILPEFELLTLDSVWYSQAGKDERFETWFDAFNYIYEEAMRIEFDIALLGCGFFGFPLAIKLKDAGKQAIHMGSASQLLFGITGKRWEEGGGLDKYVNQYWTKPPKTTAPKHPDKLDEGCYW